MNLKEKAAAEKAAASKWAARAFDPPFTKPCPNRRIKTLRCNGKCFECAFLAGVAWQHREEWKCLKCGSYRHGTATCPKAKKQGAKR